MRMKLTLFLLLLNAALFTFILVLEEKPTVLRRQNSERPLVLPPGFVQSLTQLTVQTQEDKTNWMLEKQDGRWFLTKPYRWPANEYAVRRLLALLAMLTWERRFSFSEARAAGLSLANYGLQPPAASIFLSTGDSSHLLKLGQPTEVGQQVYLLHGQEEDIYVVQASLLTALSWQERELTDPFIFQLSGPATHSISLTTGSAPHQRTRLTRQNDLWVFESPTQARADSEQVETALAALLGLQVLDFLEREEITQGFSDPWRLTLASDRQRETLLIGAQRPDGRHFAKLEGLDTVFTIASEPLAVWKTARESLRDRRLLPFSPAAVSGIEITQKDQKVLLQKLENGSWQVISAEGGRLPAEQEVVNKLLRQLEQTQIQRFVTDAPSNSDLQQAGLLEPQRIFTLHHGNRLVLSIGQLDPASNQFYARSSHQATLVMIRPDLLVQFPVQSLHYRSRVLQELPASAVIRRLAVENIADGQTVWEANFLPGASIEPPVELLRQHFAKLRVRQYLPEPLGTEIRVDGQWRPWRYRVRVLVELPSGDGQSRQQEHLYRLTERLGSSLQYGASEESGQVYLLEQGQIDAWQAVLDTRPIPAPAQAATEDQALPAPASPAQ